MKEILKKIIAVFILMMILLNSSLLLVISTAVDEIDRIIDESKINPLYEISLDKYVNHNIENNIGTLLQFNLKTGIEYIDGEEYKPLNLTKMLLNLPKIEDEYPESIEVIGKSTKATNGSDNAKDFNFTYNKENGKLEIITENKKDKDGKIYEQKVEGARDEYILICYYSSNCFNNEGIERNLEITGLIEENIADIKEVRKSVEISESYGVKDDISGLVSTNVMTSDIYNGYINSNKKNGTQYKTEYIENLEVNISKKEISDEAIINIKNSFIYKKSGSQSLASFSLSASLKSHITVEIEGGKISLEKIDMDTLSSEPRGEAALTGAVYEIKDENGKIVDTLVTDSEGKAMSKMLPFGRYTVKETIPSTGYLLDEKIYTVELQKSSQENITVVSSKEKVIEHEIAFMKVYNDGNTGIMKPEMQITFDIYDKDDNKVSTVTTNKEGYVSLKLPYGTYTVRQQNTSPYYEKVSDFKLYVYEDKKEVVNYVLSDALVKAKLKVIKMDAETKEKIQVSGVKFKIKNLETGEYVKQEVTYPKKEIVDTFQTDETGEFMTPNFLMGGRYQLEEIVAPSGYLISHPIPFTIDHIYMSGENVVEVVVEDSKPKAKLEIVKTGDKISYQKGIHQLKSIYEKVPLAGATFQVLANEEIQNQDHIYQKGDIIEEIVTDQAGHAESSLLPLGSYCIKETLAPLGYKKEDQLQCVEVKFKDQITPVIIETLKVHNIRERNQYFFQKLGQVFVGLEQNEGVYQNVSLSDVTFGLYTKDHMNFGEIFVDSDTLIEKIVTDEKGIGYIKTELPDGRYYLKELDVPNLYEKNSQIYEFTLNETTKHQEEVLREPIVNKIKKGTLELEKQDKETSQILYGAEFEFQYENLSPIPLTLDQGNIILKNVPYGTYTFRETKAPNYYRKSLDQQKILLEEDHRKIIFYNDRVIVPKTSNTMRYFRLTIFTLCGFGFMLVIGSRWVAKRQGLY